MFYDLRADPFEMAGEGGSWERWRAEHAFVLVPAQAFVGQHLMTYKDFPPRQKAGSFSLDAVLEKLQQPESR
jgi:arylsulfatase